MFRPVMEKGYGYRYPQRYGLRRIALYPNLPNETLPCHPFGQPYCTERVETTKAYLSDTAFFFARYG
jgi:hypothetical protein